ncbi:MAG: methyltransferase [Bacteroidetes bacterium CG12_big_fil_rev_8_21_14_0_65_60_17]|nr:MAG: methyltransferase [Bacteroidetes bacterium CG12_big_fil_rev_8_21_14_0_65_60_17]
MIRLSKRRPDLEEIMDRDDCDADALERTYRAFVHINRWLSGWGRLYGRYVRPVLEHEAARREETRHAAKSRVPAGLEHGKPIRIVDVGCGGGDVLRYVMRRARRDGFDVEGLGVDPDGRAIRFAREKARTSVDPPMSFLEGHLEDVSGPVDIIISNHLLHHMTDREVRQLLAAGADRAALVCIHNDIARSWAALVLFQVVRPLFPRTFVGVDGTRSIQRAFTARELAALAGPDWMLVRAAPFRAGLLFATPHRLRDELAGAAS